MQKNLHGLPCIPSTPLLKSLVSRMIAALLRVRGGAGLEKMCWIVGAADDHKPCRLAGRPSGVGAEWERRNLLARWRKSAEGDVLSRSSFERGAGFAGRHRAAPGGICRILHTRCGNIARMRDGRPPLPLVTGPAAAACAAQWPHQEALMATMALLLPPLLSTTVCLTIAPL